MNISLVDLTSVSLSQEKKYLEVFKKVLKSGDFVLGREVEIFENEFAKYIGTKYCIAVASGTDALILSLKALGVGENDEVIIPAMTFIATATAVLQIGATPILIDITSDMPLIDVSKIEEKITKRTKAIIPVHLQGNICNMELLQKIARKYKLAILEDASQAHGSNTHNKNAGSFGDIAGFSFYPSKNLGAFGDAGAITTSDKKLRDKLVILRNQGQKEKYIHQVVGFNSRLDTLQAGILRIKLSALNKQNEKRRTYAAVYSRLLKDLPVKLPSVNKGVTTNYHIYAIRVDKRNQLLSYLKSKNIACGIHYPLPLHKQPSLKFLNYKKGDFPNSEKFADQTLSLPMYPELTKDKVAYICKQIRSFFKR